MVEFTDFDIHTLNCTIAQFCLPRVKAFKEKCIEYNLGNPNDLSMEEWIVVLDKIIKGFETMTVSSPVFSSVDKMFEYMDISNAAEEEGCMLFGKYLDKMCI